MPFTAAHPLAVMPLLRGRHLGLDPTCLVIGSMAPDFEYFARVEMRSTISHTVRGLWQWNLPVALAVAVLTHALIKWPMLLAAPAVIARRALRDVAAPWRVRWGPAALASCAVSAVLGAATHLVWDGLTHANGWGPSRFHALSAKLVLPAIGPVVLHRLLQHTSTAIGLIGLGALAVRWLRRARPTALPEGPRLAARLVLVAALAAGTAWGVARASALPGSQAGDLIVGAIAGALAGTAIGCALLSVAAYRFARRVRAARAPVAL
jgi:hypothetical protein